MRSLSWEEWLKWLDDAPIPRSFVNEKPEPEVESARERALKRWKMEEKEKQ
jgi:hypothetical protein